jgi:hypothetical protein
MSRLGVILWLVLYALVAYAGPKEDASAKRKAGDKMMEEGAFEEALTFYDEARALFADPALDLSRGDALLKLRRYEESRASYQKYLDNAKTNKRKTEVKKALGDIDRILQTFLNCQSEPMGATIYLNSRVDGEIGPTPLNFNIPPGTHRIIFVKQGFKTKTETITIEEGEKAILNTKLEAAPLIVEVSTTPGNAEIFVDKKLVGKSPALIELSEGAHELELRLAGFQTLSTKVEGKAGEKTPLAHNFIESPSQLRVVTEPLIEGTFEVKGREVIGTLGEPLALPPGEYNVVVNALGYKKFVTTVTIEKAKTTESKITLEPLMVKLLVKANVPSFTVLIDDTTQALTASAFELTPGKHAIKVTAAGYNDYQTEILCKAGELSVLDTQLSLQHRKLTFGMIALSAPVFVVGASLGLRALENVELANRVANKPNLVIPFASTATKLGYFADASYVVGSLSLGLGLYRYFIKEGPSKSTITKLPKGNP